MRAKVEIVIPLESGSATDRDQLFSLAEAAVVKADSLLSPFGERSDIRRLNEAKAGEKVKVDSLTILVIDMAISWNEKTLGLFDPTIGPIKKLYRFDGGILDAWPEPAAIQNALANVGLENLTIDRKTGELSFAKDGCYLDLGGIAKGFAADLAAEVLLKEGVRNAIVNVGGEMRVLGIDPQKTPPGPWTIGVTDPLNRESQYEIEAQNQALATSGSYRSFFEYEGKRYSHILDPRDGRPVEENVVGVTVGHPNSATAADVLATVFYLLGVQGAEDYLRQHGRANFPDGLDVALFSKEGPDSLSVVTFKLDREGTLAVERP
jgi:thiamine biosynthesis lipoprotein